MLSDLFQPFIEGSPPSVMMRGLVERLLNPDQIDQWFKRFAQEQYIRYIRELLFSTVVSLMLEVVCGPRKSVHAAYQAMEAAIPVSIPQKGVRSCLLSLFRQNKKSSLCLTQYPKLRT